jgi:Winged helix DNA-binding domain
MSWQAVTARRLARQGLAAPLDGGPAEVVRAMCGAHAQVMSAGELSIGLRLAGSTREDVQRAVWTDRTLVKTRGPRGTVHLLPSADLPMWTGALSALPASLDLLTPDQVEEVVAAIRDALDDSELTVAELTEEVVARTGSWAGDRVLDAFQDKWPRWVQALGAATWRGAVCFGPARGRAQTYTSPRRWLPGFVPDDQEPATRELVRHYLRAYGPATPQHFARWLGVPVTWASAKFASAELEEVEVADQRMWQLAGDKLPAATVDGVRLLPYFDAYGIAAQPRERIFPGKMWDRALARGQAGNYPVVLVDGVVAGVWHLRRSGRKATITVECIGRPGRRAIANEVSRIEAFLNCKADLVFDTVTVGAHA